ncbi:MAG: insulinase family protein [Gemmatimonas sp.]|nr:insulinase family protein [Gemmatimonas sp.]
MVPAARGPDPGGGSEVTSRLSLMKLSGKRQIRGSMNRTHPVVKLVCLVSMLSVVAIPAIGQTGTTVRSVTDPVQLELETYELSNGLNVVLSRDRSVPVVAVNLWYHVGSGNEEPGRTGFAHLFEHMMFQGSENVGDDAHFRYVQEAGGTLNGSTNTDRTNYYQAVPSNFLERVLWLESDRMSALLPALTPEKLDNQRSVVQNERRQRYENAPYGLAFETLSAALYPEGHPYSWTTIGSMADLNAASQEDVQAFFEKHYVPNNASLAIVGDFEPDQAKAWVEQYFSDIPPGSPIDRPDPAPVQLETEKRLVLEDRVQLPRLYIAWPTPALYEPGDAELDILGGILTGGRSSRLYRRLVFEDQLAQFVSASQSSRQMAGQYGITVQARPGVELSRLEEIVDEELARLLVDPPTEREMQRALNNLEASFIQQMETNLGRADRLNAYATYGGDPAFLVDDFERYRNVTIEGILDVVRRYLGPERVVLSVIPEGSTDLQASR